LTELNNDENLQDVKKIFEKYDVDTDSPESEAEKLYLEFAKKINNNRLFSVNSPHKCKFVVYTTNEVSDRMIEESLSLGTHEKLQYILRNSTHLKPRFLVIPNIKYTNSFESMHEDSELGIESLMILMLDEVR
jgi:hypothetical protein